VPTTERNEAALKEFCERMTKLRELIADYLKPDKIEETTN